MRVSPLRHNLARLRVFLNLGQKELAALLHCSRVTIQKIELGKLKMSPDFADHVYRVTDVSAHWLLRNNLKAPIVTTVNEPYTREHFERKRAIDTDPLPCNPLGTMRVHYIWLHGLLALFTGHCFGPDHSRFMYEFSHTLKNFTKEFPRDQKLLREVNNCMVKLPYDRLPEPEEFLPALRAYRARFDELLAEAKRKQAALPRKRRKPTPPPARRSSPSRTPQDSSAADGK